MPDMYVTIHNSWVYHRHTISGNTSVNHDLNTLAAAPNHLRMVGLTADQFVRFKNGGKRRPSTLPKQLTTSGAPAQGPQAPAPLAQIHQPPPAPFAPAAAPVSRVRPDRRADVVKVGDIGRYKTEPTPLQGHPAPPAKNNLIAPKLCGHLNYPVDPAIAGLKIERDHINSQMAMHLRANVYGQGVYAGQNMKKTSIGRYGLAIAIPHDIHAGGFTYGGKQKKKDQVIPGTHQLTTREVFCALYPDGGMEKEFDAELHQFQQLNQLTCEIVGSYRYLYRLSVAWTYVKPTAALDNLLLNYLGIAT